MEFVVYLNHPVVRSAFSRNQCSDKAWSSLSEEPQTNGSATLFVLCIFAVFADAFYLDAWGKKRYNRGRNAKQTCKSTKQSNVTSRGHMRGARSQAIVTPGVLWGRPWDGARVYTSSSPYLMDANMQPWATRPDASGTKTSRPVSSNRLTHSNTCCDEIRTFHATRNFKTETTTPKLATRTYKGLQLLTANHHHDSSCTGLLNVSAPRSRVMCKEYDECDPQ